MTNYSIVIRTLGTGGGKYQRLLDSIKSQTIQPKHIFVFIAEGYELPAEQIGTEEFIYTRKGVTVISDSFSFSYNMSFTLVALLPAVCRRLQLLLHAGT